MSATVPLGFLPSPADYAGHYVQLASRANAAATTGIVVACDGGLDVRGLGLRCPGRVVQFIAERPLSGTGLGG